MSYASLVGLPDARHVPIWWWTWAEGDGDQAENVLDERVWEWGDQPTYEAVGDSGFAICYASGSRSVEPGDPIFRNDNGDTAAVCADACLCCHERRPALRSGAWSIATILAHLT